MTDGVRAARMTAAGVRSILATTLPAAAAIFVFGTLYGTGACRYPALSQGDAGIFGAPCKPLQTAAGGAVAASVSYALARGYRADAAVRFQADGCPTVVNDDASAAFLADRVRTTMGASTVTSDATSRVSDDVSLFLQQRPGCYFFIGAAPDRGPPRPHHAPEFEMNERSLAVGLRAGLEVVAAALSRK